MDAKNVTSLALSQYLKALGVPQESEFYWECLRTHEHHSDLFTLVTKEKYKAHSMSPDFVYYSAFLVSELGEMLPIKCTSWSYGENEKYWLCVCNETEKEINGCKTECEARGLMLAYLKEEKLI